MSTEQTDEQLMRAYQSGDTSAFRALYDRHAGKVIAYLGKRLDRREERDEVFQQIFGKLHQSRYGYDPQYPFVQWLFVITKTVLIDHWAKESSKLGRATEKPVEDQEIADSSRTAENMLVHGIEPEILGAGGLTPEQQQAVRWRVLDEMSYEEMASRLNRSEATVRQMVSRALRRLKDVMTGAEVGSGLGKEGKS